MITIQISKSTGKVIHKDLDVETVLTNLPPQASLKAIFARAKAMGLKVRDAS